MSKETWATLVKFACSHSHATQVAKTARRVGEIYVKEKGAMSHQEKMRKGVYLVMDCVQVGIIFDFQLRYSRQMLYPVAIWTVTRPRRWLKMWSSEIALIVGTPLPLPPCALLSDSACGI